MNMPPLENSAAPLYVRLKQALLTHITGGLGAGDRLPSESELEERYGVSRITVRQALGALESEGVVVRKQGRGTFVCPPKVSLPHVTSIFDAEGRESGDRPATRELVSLDRISPPARVSELLGTADVYRIRLLTHLGEGEICYHIEYLPTDVFNDVTEIDIRSGALADEIAKMSSAGSNESSSSVEAVLADTFRAKLLHVAVGSPVLLVQRVTRNSDGKTLKITRAFYPGHSFRFELPSGFGDRISASIPTLSLQPKNAIFDELDHSGLLRKGTKAEDANH